MGVLKYCIFCACPNVALRQPHVIVAVGDLGMRLLKDGAHKAAVFVYPG